MFKKKRVIFIYLGFFVLVLVFFCVLHAFVIFSTFANSCCTIASFGWCGERGKRFT